MGKDQKIGGRGDEDKVKIIFLILYPSAFILVSLCLYPCIPLPLSLYFQPSVNFQLQGTVTVVSLVADVRYRLLNA